MFNFLARNNGAQRKLFADFSDTAMVMAWQQWTVNNPLALSSQPQ
jgi:accessory colonization factor AcfC